MLPKQILSVQHPFVKRCVGLRLERAAREAEGCALVVGETMVRELSERLALQALITTAPQPEIRAAEHYVVSPEVLKKIAGVQAPDGFAALAPLPAPRALVRAERIVILDRIADPGNLGTLLRTALGLGWDAVVLTPGCVDPFNDKALRASRGAPFFLPLSYATPDEITAFAGREGLSVVVADLEGTPLASARCTPPLALVLSHESDGVAPWARTLGTPVCIPMRGDVESLNVAVSGAILLHALGPR